MAMNGTSPTETEAALVVWVNSFSLSVRIDSLSELSDGQAFWEMLCEINPESFTGELPSRKQSDYAREENLHFIYEQVSSYLDERSAIYKSLSHEDIRIIASDGSSALVSKACLSDIPTTPMKTNRGLKLLKLILLVVLTPPNAYVLNQMSTLPQRTQKVLETLIREIDPSQSPSDDEDTLGLGGFDTQETESHNGLDSSSARKVNRELELEAQLAEAQSKLDRRNRMVEILGAEKTDLNETLSRLHESYEAVKRQSEHQDHQIGKLTSAHNGRDQVLVRELEAKISQQEEIISGQKIQNIEQQSSRAELQRKFDKLNTTAEDFQKLQDDFHIQKRDLEYQTKKANAGEKYKQKVLGSQAIEKQRDTLRQQLDDVLPKVKAYEEMRRDNARLTKENREITSTLEQSERGNNELRETKQIVVAENKRLQRDLKATREAYAHIQEGIADSEGRSSGSEIQLSPTVMDGGLESELAATSKREEQMQVTSTLLQWARGLMDSRKSRILELEKHNWVLTSDAIEKELRVAMPQKQLDSAHDTSADQSAKELRLRQDISSLESSIIDMRQGHPFEGFVLSVSKAFDHAHNSLSTETFTRMRTELKETTTKCNELEEKLSAAHRDTETANNDRTSAFENHCMMSDLNIDLLEGELAGRHKLGIVEEVKRQYSGALMQLQGDYDALKKRHNRLQDEYDKQWEERNQAWRESHEALVAKAEEETKGAANSRMLSELRELVLQATSNNPTESKMCVEQIVQKARDMEAKAQQGINEQDARIKDLEARLKARNADHNNDSASHPAATATAPEPQGVQSRDEKAYTQNLEREIKLMASAYHDLAGRLQMNNVVLQRRAEAPKSWLSRQRKAMEGVGGVVR